MTERRPLGTPAQVGEYLGVPVATLYQWTHKGIGPKVARVGRHLRYQWADIDAWLEEQARGGGAAA